MEPDSHEEIRVAQEVPEEDTAAGWFLLGCSFATKSKLLEAERALKIAVDMQEDYSFAWSILSAVLLAQGRETDAEKAGKMALEQCPDLKMTWPKLRSIITSQAIQKGKDWKSPRKVRIDATDTTDWGLIIKKLAVTIEESLDKIESHDEEEESSESLDTAVAMGMANNSKSESIESETHIDKTDDKTPQRSPEFWFSTARGHLNKREFDKAEKAFERGLVLDPENGDALLRVGTLLMKREVNDRAEEALRKAVKYSPESSEAWLQLGICLQAQDKWQESSEILKIASEKNPRNVEIWVKLGEADYYRSMYQDAARSFLRALRILPNHKFALFYLGRCMEYRGNGTHALRIYRKLMDLEPDDPEILEELSKSFHRLGEIQTANRAKTLAAYHRKSKTDNHII